MSHQTANLAHDPICKELFFGLMHKIGRRAMQIGIGFSRSSKLGIGVLVHQTKEELLANWIMCQVGSMVSWKF